MASLMEALPVVETLKVQQEAFSKSNKNVRMCVCVCVCVCVCMKLCCVGQSDSYVILKGQISTLFSVLQENKAIWPGVTTFTNSKPLQTPINNGNRIKYIVKTICITR